MGLKEFCEMSPAKVTELQGTPNNKFSTARRIVTKYKNTIEGYHLIYTIQKIIDKDGKQLSSKRSFSINSKGVCRRAFRNQLSEFNNLK